MTPIKPGTARRLGLGRPEPRPRGFVKIGVPISDKHYAEFVQGWREAYERQRQITAEGITRAFDVPADWVSQEEWMAAKATPRRPWWRFW